MKNETNAKKKLNLQNILEKRRFSLNTQHNAELVNKIQEKASAPVNQYRVPWSSVSFIWYTNRSDAKENPAKKVNTWVRISLSERSLDKLITNNKYSFYLLCFPPFSHLCAPTGNFLIRQISTSKRFNVHVKSEQLMGTRRNHLDQQTLSLSWSVQLQIF